MPNDETLKISKLVHGQLADLKTEYEHKSFDSVLRQLLRESGLMESGGRTLLSNPQGGLMPSEPDAPYWIGTVPDSDVYLGAPLQALDHNVAILGQTGTGKSTLLEALFSQQIQRGDGGLYFDISGQGVLKILQALPAEREEDVVIIQPNDNGATSGINLLKTYRNPADPGYEREVEAIAEAVLTLLKTDSEWASRNDHLLRKLFQYFPEQESTLYDLYKALCSESSTFDPSADPSNPWLPAVEQCSEQLSLSSSEIEPLLRRLEQQVGHTALRNTIHHPSSLSLEEATREKKIILVTSNGLPNVAREICLALGERLHSILSTLSDTGDTDDHDSYRVYIDEITHIDRAAIDRWLATANRRNHNFLVTMQPAANPSFHSQHLPKDVETICAFRTSEKEATTVLANALGPGIDTETITTTHPFDFYYRSLHSSSDSTEATKVHGLNDLSALTDSSRTDSEIEELIASSKEQYGSKSDPE